MVKISALPEVNVPAPDDKLPIVDESGNFTGYIKNSNLTGYPSLGWITAGETWSYASWNATTRIGTLTVPTDATTKYSPGMRIQIAQSTGGTKYGIIHAVSSTLLTVFFPSGTTLNNEAISSPFYTPVSNPIGFDADPSKWQISASSSSDRSTSSATLASLTDNFVVGVGAWEVVFKPLVRITNANDATNRYGKTTLSTDGSTETNPKLTVAVGLETSGPAGVADTGVYTTGFARDYVNLASETTFTMMGLVNVSSATLTIYGAFQATRMVATSAYL